MKGPSPVRDLLKIIPWLLILFRGALGLAAILIAWFAMDPSGTVLAVLVVVGVLSDVFDGVLARRLKVSTDRLRVWDSRADVIFFTGLVVSIVIRSPGLLLPIGLFFLGIALLELSVHLISFLRFQRQSSTHHYLSKAFSVFLFGLVVQVLLYPEVTWYFWFVSALGTLSFLEAGLIMLSLKAWQCDIRTVFDLQDGVVVRKGENPMGREE